MATKRWKNAQRVRFNVETKVNPRTDEDPLHPGVRVFADRARLSPSPSRRAVARRHCQQRHAGAGGYPELRFPHSAGGAASSSRKSARCISSAISRCLPIQAITGSRRRHQSCRPQAGASPYAPWLAGMFWPYRCTELTQPVPGAEQRRLRRHGIESGPTGTGCCRCWSNRSRVTDPRDPCSMHEFDLASRELHRAASPQVSASSRGAPSIGDFILHRRTSTAWSSSVIIHKAI